MSGIGLLNEKSLHAALKLWYAQPGDRFEVEVDGYIVDLVRADLLVEIQTGNFASIKTKLTSLVRSHQLRLVYPIAREKWIVKRETREGDGATRRRSPKRGRMEDLFREMVSLPHLLSSRNFSLEVLMIKEEETRRYEGSRRWQRRGWATEERRLLDVVDRKTFETATDWLGLLPAGLNSFTTADLADAKGIRRELAQKMAYLFRKAKLIELAGKRGRANLYIVGA